MFRTIPIGKADSNIIKCMKLVLKLVKNCENKLKPGNKIGEVFDAHANFDDSVLIRLE